MQQHAFSIFRSTALTSSVTRLDLTGDCSGILPGQFVDIRIPPRFLRRPFSVADVNDNRLTVVFETVGAGTEQLRQLPAGTVLDVLTGLGNGFDLSSAGEKPLLIGGGTGAAPLYLTARALKQQGCSPVVLLGFRKHEDTFFIDDFRSVGIEPVPATEDGSVGIRGTVTDALPELLPFSCTSFYACGPQAMLRAVAEYCPLPGQLSFSERLGCGFGACMGCTIKTASGWKRVCKDGPVFRKEEPKWDA
ncbi:MAG: dihydroorotate dehydrogenase electron transfer subunit [Oscillospiraceae bacterium]|nr:dihydroorotate dehydrogenase electron transfer subunit [Oscillospiraceae bacterium]